MRSGASAHVRITLGAPQHTSSVAHNAAADQSVWAREKGGCLWKECAKFLKSHNGQHAALRDVEPVYVRFGSEADNRPHVAEPGMSALPPKADIELTCRHVRFCAGRFAQRPRLVTPRQTLVATDNYRQKFLNRSGACNAPCAGCSCGRAKPVTPVCRGRRWLGHSRSHAAACADVSGIASWPEPRSDRIAHGRPWASSAHPARS